MYISGAQNYDFDGDGQDDFCVYEGNVEPDSKIPAKASISSLNLTDISAHLQSSVFKLSKDLIDSIHEEGIVAYTS